MITDRFLSYESAVRTAVQDAELARGRNGFSCEDNHTQTTHTPTHIHTPYCCCCQLSYLLDISYEYDVGEINCCKRRERGAG